MSDVISIYQRLIIHQISYETGDRSVMANCEIQPRNGETVRATLLISHTDLNRIFAKLTSSGQEFGEGHTDIQIPDDDTRIIDFQFENVYGQGIVLENFQFVKQVREIRA